MTELNLFLSHVEEENSQENQENKSKILNEHIEPFYLSGVTNNFLGAEGIPISYRIFMTQNSKAKVILATGYNESYLKYSELIWNLSEMGFSVYCFDHRGQGYSGRFINQEKRGYVDKFAHYIDDLCCFYNYVNSLEDTRSPIFILAHSMGGAITIKALDEQKVSPNGVILSAPMFEIFLSPIRILEIPVYILSTLFCFFGFSKKYIFGQKDCIPNLSFEKNDVTHSKFRFFSWRKKIASEEQMQIGGPTFGWAKEAIKASRKARKYGKNNKTPILILQPGADTVVRNCTQNEFVSHCTMSEVISFPFAKHEILMEVDFIRKNVLDQIKHFILSKL